MAILSPSFLFALVVLLYLSSFIFFAILRILTGISIQRIGYFSLRRLAYTPKDGVRVEIRGLGINLHRPTFAQHTWLSIVVSEFAVTVDIEALGTQRGQKGRRASNKSSDSPSRQKSAPHSQHGGEDSGPTPVQQDGASNGRKKGWRELNKLKDRLKRLHRHIAWLRLVDVVATNASLTVLDVGSVHLGTFTLSVDTRRKMVDQGHIFSRTKQQKKQQEPAEWKLTARSFLLTADGRESLEILDHATLNINGLLYSDVDGLRDIATELKLGRLHIPTDDIKICLSSYQKYSKLFTEATERAHGTSIPVVTESRLKTSNGNDTTHDSDIDEFFNSILGGVREIQFAISHIGLTKSIDSTQTGGIPLYLNASMKEVGIDLYRLDPKSPTHRMYFSSPTIAHQALLAALSIAIKVDDGHGKSDRLAYIPMVTTTIRTTLPSKAIGSKRTQSVDERNANILFANVVITSPSVDLDPKHLPLLIALMHSRPRSSGRSARSSYELISRWLPKANIKFSMHEPVFRISLPPVEKAADEDDFDLIISSISSISLDTESSHSGEKDVNYALNSMCRVQSHDLYYQTCSGVRYDLLRTEFTELKVQVNASPDINVVIFGILQTCFIHMSRPELTEGIREIVRQLRTNVESNREASSETAKQSNLVRALPSWLVHLQIQASNFNAEVAGVDADVSDDIRGVALQLDSCTAEYRAHRDEFIERKPSRRRAGSRSMTPDIEFHRNTSQFTKDAQHSTDGRLLDVHVRGLEAFVVESVDKWEAEPFLAIPRFDVASSTSSDIRGSVFDVKSHVETLLIQYSLYRNYAIAVAVTVLRKALVCTKADIDATTKSKASRMRDEDRQGHLYRMQHAPNAFSRENLGHGSLPNECLTVDIKVMLVQVKADMAGDLPILLQIYGVGAGRHRWSAPFFSSRLARLYVETPKMRRVWSRLVSIKNAKMNLRKAGHNAIHESSYDDSIVDVNTDAIRLAVPHQVVMHKIFDSIVNTIKAIEQLHHRFKTETNEYILEKSPVRPKRVPKISVRSRALLFELEDGAFEWKLGNIYRSGLIEQQQRLAREKAFRVKVQKIEEEAQRRSSSAARTRSAHPRGRSPRHRGSHKRSKSEEYPRQSRRSKSTKHYRMRYDPRGSCGMSAAAKISVEEASEKLQQYNAQSWKKRIDQSYIAQMNGTKEMRDAFWGPDELPDGMEETEDVLEVPRRPALMSTLISNLHITIDKPSFPLSGLPEFLHRIGKGMPYDMKYSLLIPMHVKIDMEELRMLLRDYPLPLIHVPSMKPGQSSRSPSWSLQTDFVIAEEFRGRESIRNVKVDIVPSQDANLAGQETGGFAIDVRRTVSPVKSYSDINVDINTGFPTRISWGASYQPAIQDMMMVIEGFTKPQIDPSDRTGFWDKIRLSFHSRLLVSWKGDGDVHLLLKGTRDPYEVTGNGAGFLMCWRNDVQWSICRDDDPKKFMTVDSANYILAIPDYSQQALVTTAISHKDANTISGDSYRRGATFKKVIMKLSGKVQWLAGLVFERNIVGGKRSFDFIPHYDVVLREPRYAQTPLGEEYDAYSGFRSNHIHLSLAVAAPVNQNVSAANATQSNSYNSVHLTPRFFTHFFAWWSMFGGTMSLPVRQGRLWPGIEKSSKKFGRHLATIKYSILLAPLFMSHVYKHKEAEENAEDTVSVTGLKIRFDRFMLDIHQRREWFNTQDRSKKTHNTTTGIKIHKAQLDLVSADVRAISATVAGTTSENPTKTDSPLTQSPKDVDTADLSRFIIPDNDFTWIDMDDFVELDWILPSESNPETKIMPLAYAPRFSYFRQTDHGDTIAGDPDRTSPFGNEPTHYCVMLKDGDAQKVQCDLIHGRLSQLEQQIREHKHNIRDTELQQIRSGDSNPSLRSQLAEMRNYHSVLQQKHSFLENMLHHMEVQIKNESRDTTSDSAMDSQRGSFPPENQKDSMDEKRAGEAGPTDSNTDFDNRFVIHNIQLKWNNGLRNTILRYFHQVSQRRGFVYYLSRRAVKFILDIVEEQDKTKRPKRQAPTPPNTRSSAPPSSTRTEFGSQLNIEERIEGLLADSKKFVDANDPGDSESGPRGSAENLTSNIGKDFLPQNTYHLRLIALQVQLQSEKNPNSVALVTAKGMELKVVEVMDKSRIFDEVSGLVQRRYSVAMDGSQFFVTHKNLYKSPILSFNSPKSYGTAGGSLWPPWAPMEVMYDFELDPVGFKRVVQKTSASLRYDQYNTLRLKYNDEIDRRDDVATDSPDSRMNHLWVRFPQIRAICDSSQYHTLYIIVLDLLLYSEPLEKTRSERLVKIMLASDFSDLRGAPEMVIRLQERIRQLEGIKTQFQIHSDFLDEKGWEDRILLDRDLTSCEDELFFIMKAITTSQRKHDGSQNNGLLRWNIASDQIVWHLMRDKSQPLMEFQLQKAEYDRTDNSDGSHVNLMQVDKIVGLNLLPDAIYPEMIVPYLDPERRNNSEGKKQQMVRVYWYMLEAIAGIQVVDHFEVNLFPMKIQLEREVGTKLFEYIFPGSGDKASSSMKGSASFMKNIPPVKDEDEEDEDDEGGNHNEVASEIERTDGNTGLTSGLLEVRLRPTLNSEDRPKTALPQKKNKMGGFYQHGAEGSTFRLFQPNKSHTMKPQTSKGVQKKPSLESMRLGQSRPTITRSTTSYSNAESSVTASDGKNKRFTIIGNSNQKSEKPSDDLTKMLSRASSYKTLAYVKIPSVVICLSYKGRDQRNIEDLHDFVFRLPTLEYRNKVWSNLDLALALKKDFIRALISHAGSIIGNKFVKSRPSAAQQYKLRELAKGDALIVPDSQDSQHEPSDTSSVAASSSADAEGRIIESPRSLTSNESYLRPATAGSSGAKSYSSAGQVSGNNSSLAMTKSDLSNPESESGKRRHSGDSYWFHTLAHTNEQQQQSGFLNGSLGRKLHGLGGKGRDNPESSANAGTSAAAEEEDIPNASHNLKKKMTKGKKILGKRTL